MSAVVGGIESVLQRLKIGSALPAFGFDHDLAVDPAVRKLQCGHRLRQVLEPRRPIVAAAREKSDVAAVDASEHAIAVKFDLIDPVASTGRGSGKRCELRCESERQFRRSRAVGQRHGIRASLFRFFLRRSALFCRLRRNCVRRCSHSRCRVALR